MKIGIFTDAYEPHISGVTTSINMLKTALENEGHTVYIVTTNLAEFKFKYDKENKIIYIPGIKTGILFIRLTNTFSKKAFKIIKSWNLDIIHTQTELTMGTFSPKTAKKLNIPVIHTYHTLYEDYAHYVFKGHFTSIVKKTLIKINKRYFNKNCDELIVPTTKIKDIFQNKYAITKKINVIPTGIDTKKFALTKEIQNEVNKLKKQYNISTNDFIIGAVGRIAKEKSFDKLIKASKKLINDNKNIKLIIIGDGPELENLKQLSKELGISKNIIFTGKVLYNLIPYYYNLFNIMTSFSTTETQGLTIIEGLSASLPIICIEDDSFKSMVTYGYNGYLFKTESEFQDLVNKIIKDQKLYKEISNNAMKSIYKYSKEVFAKNVLKVYQNALKRAKNSNK